MTLVAEYLSDRMVLGLDWFERNAERFTGKRWNVSWEYDFFDAEPNYCSEHDSTMSVGVALEGLRLRYQRLGQRDDLRRVDVLLNHMLELEAEAVRQHGALASGMAPYWIHPGGTDYVSAGRPSGLGYEARTYSRGDVLGDMSSDQATMLGFGAYNVGAHLADEGLVHWERFAEFLRRFASFESSAETADVLREDYGPDGQVGANIVHKLFAEGSAVANGLTEAFANTATERVNPAAGLNYGLWMIDNTDGIAPGTVMNTSSMDFARGIVAPDTTLAGLQKLLKGAAADMLMHDLGAQQEYNAVYTDLATPVGTYPLGWHASGSVPGTSFRYSVEDGHRVQIVAGPRDQFYGRGAQHAMLLAWCALFNPGYLIPLNAVDTIAVEDAAKAAIGAFASFLVQPDTSAASFARNRAMGGTVTRPEVRVDSSFTSYALCAAELYLAAKAGRTTQSVYGI